MTNIFRFRSATCDSFTRGKLYEVDVLKQRDSATYRLGTVIDDDGDERIFFAEDFKYVPPAEVSDIDFVMVEPEVG